MISKHEINSSHSCLLTIAKLWLSGVAHLMFGHCKRVDRAVKGNAGGQNKGVRGEGLVLRSGIKLAIKRIGLQKTWVKNVRTKG